MIRLGICAAVCVSLIGCGSSNSSTTFNPSDVSADIGEDEIAFAADNVQRTLIINADQRTDGFVSASDEDSRLFIAQDDTSIAALLVTDNTVVTPYYVRLTAFEDFPTGQAKASGRYIGQLADEETAFFEINGDVTITADFDNRSLSGNITNRLGYIDGLPFAFIMPNDIDLGEANIDAVGRFQGPATLVADGVAGDSGDFKGLLVGPDGDSFVGQVTIETMSDFSFDQDDPFPTIETGVFTAGQ